jgi:hypothetical protein
LELGLSRLARAFAAWAGIGKRQLLEHALAL